jgi:hypothetical protein
MSAGLLLLVIGLANLAAQAQATRMNSVTGAVGGISILAVGTLLALANGSTLVQPQTLVLRAVGAVLTVRRLQKLTVTSDR